MLNSLRKNGAKEKAAMPNPKIPSPRQALHEDALRFGQQIVDLQQERDELYTQLEQERTTRILAEGELDAARRKNAELEKQLEHRNSELQRERDMYRVELNTIQTKLSVAATVILDCYPGGRGAPNPAVDLDRMGKEVVAGVRAAGARVVPDEEPLPSIVTKGPRDYPGGDQP